MPSNTATNTYGNANPNVGGPYLDTHCPTNVTRLRNSAPSAFCFPEGSANTTASGNDSSGTATSTNEPGFAAQYTINTTAAQLEQGKMV